MITFTTLASSSKGNCFHVKDGSTPLLLECGISFKDIQRKLNFKTSGLAACLITHEHKDHSKAVTDLMKFGFDCYMSQGTADALGLSGHRVKIVKVLEPFKVGSWIIMPFDTQHDAAEPLGFLLANQSGDKLLFATDTYYIKYKFKGLTHIAVECNYDLGILKKNIDAGVIPVAMKNRLLQSHFSLENVKEFLRSNDLSQVSEIHLLHLSGDNSDAIGFKCAIQRLTGKAAYIAGE
jgi:phosphoribosyl 1,2-cyclic phosphodiesterase